MLVECDGLGLRLLQVRSACQGLAAFILSNNAALVNERNRQIRGAFGPFSKVTIINLTKNSKMVSRVFGKDQVELYSEMYHNINNYRLFVHNHFYNKKKI